MEILVATSNVHKIAELTHGAKDRGYSLISPREFSSRTGRGEPPEVEETGATYLENAILKAESFSRWSGLRVIADDSGLEVDALGLRPGVASARYAGPTATDEERRQKLLREIQDAEPDPTKWTARFRTVLVYIGPTGIRIEAEATVSGLIVPPRGSAGFGYDPIFEHNTLKKTFAEIDQGEKCAVSARARAAKILFLSIDSIRDREETDR